MDVDRIVEVSAPSKVMICGSYVVLYNYISSVLTTTARMHVIVRTQPAELYEPEAHVIVESPQFGSTFQYKLNLPGTNNDPRLLMYVIIYCFQPVFDTPLGNLVDQATNT